MADSLESPENGLHRQSDLPELAKHQQEACTSAATLSAVAWCTNMFYHHRRFSMGFAIQVSVEQVIKLASAALSGPDDAGGMEPILPFIFGSSEYLQVCSSVAAKLHLIILRIALLDNVLLAWRRKGCT